MGARLSTVPGWQTCEWQVAERPLGLQVARAQGWRPMYSLARTLPAPCKRGNEFPPLAGASKPHKGASVEWHNVIKGFSREKH